MILYAKDDGTTLRAHTSHVVSAIKIIATATNPSMTANDYRLAWTGAVVHDLGKGHPIFQGQLRPGFDLEQYKLGVPHRHEISSLLFLPLIACEDRPMILDMIVAHHKSLRAIGSNPGRGLLDLVDSYSPEEIFTRHSEGWADWHCEVFPILNEYGIASRVLTINEIRSAFDYVVEYCEGKGAGRNRWRGLLMSADHLASGLQEETDVTLKGLFQSPDLTGFDTRAEAASAELYPLAKLPVNSSKPHTLVVTPTSSGKTEFLLRRCKAGRVFYLLPFQASINAMFLRLERQLNFKDGEQLPSGSRTDIRRLHASAQIEIDAGVVEETILQKHPGAAVKVMTPHQLAAIIFGIAGHEAIAIDVAGQNVILDEVHVYSEQSQAMVLELVKSLVRLGCRIHIGTATIPKALADEIVKCLGGQEMVDVARFSDEQLVTYDRHIVHKLSDEESAREYVRKAVLDGKRILFISNRVATAQERYSWAKTAFEDVPVLLVHSRFRRGDRASIEGQIEAFDNMTGPCVVCATQVVEVSLDISFDTLVTDCAPLDSLVQRYGRVNRRRNPAHERALAPVAVISPPQTVRDAKPYALETIEKTWQVLPNGELLRETEVQRLIDSIYPTIDIREIDMHLVDLDGGFKLPELHNVAKCVFLEALEIDSAAVIRLSDATEYRTRLGQDRQLLEIPVPLRSLYSVMGSWPQLKVGAYPYVCPDECYDKVLGLSIKKESGAKCIIL